MKTPFTLSIACGLALLMASLAIAHGTPIDLRVDSQTQQLMASPSYTPGRFVDAGGILLSDQPGIGVLNASRGVAVGTVLNLEVNGPLLYWDGTQLASTSATLDLLAPTGGSGEYTVNGSSGVQSGMQWATYPGSIGWDADGTFLLSPSAAAGVYGVAVQVSSPDYGTSETFAMISEYDPSNQWNALDLEAVLQLMQAAVAPALAGDYTGDGLVNEADYLQWRSEYGQSGQLASDGNGDQVVDAADYTIWRQALPATAATIARAIPEPTTAMLVSIVLLTLISFARGPICLR